MAAFCGTVRALQAKDADGVPLIMHVLAQQGWTGTLLLCRASGTPWSRNVLGGAARHGKLSTVAWLHLFGCPFDVSDAAAAPDTACLRWLLQFAAPTADALDVALRAGNVSGMAVLLRSDISAQFNENLSTGGQLACAVMIAKAGYLSHADQRAPWSYAVAKLRMLDGIHAAARLFRQRRAAAVKLQAWWRAHYYTPGRRVWRARMLREFEGLAAAGFTPRPFVSSTPGRLS